MLLLKILKLSVIDPAVANTVSKKSVSALVERLACGLVIKESFLQENATADNKNKKHAYLPGAIVINYASLSFYCLPHNGIPAVWPDDGRPVPAFRRQVCRRGLPVGAATAGSP